MKLTPWFPATTPPSRVGYYECSKCKEMHWWDGKTWRSSEYFSAPTLTDGWHWRGLREEVK